MVSINRTLPHALVAYQTLWLKTHFPAEFMAAVMTSEKMDNTDKIVGFRDKSYVWVWVSPHPDINVGKHHFSVNENGEIGYVDIGR